MGRAGRGDSYWDHQLAAANVQPNLTQSQNVGNQNQHDLSLRLRFLVSHWRFCGGNKQFQQKMIAPVLG